MGWCCERFEQCVLGVADDGCMVEYHYKEPPHNPGMKLFILRFRVGDKSAATRIYFCPWCGSNLAEWPRSEKLRQGPDRPSE